MKNRITNLIVLLFACLALSPAAKAIEYSPWSPAVNLGPVINGSANDQHPTISKDGLTLIFVSTRPGGAGGNDLYVSERDSVEDPWGPPVNLTMLNTPFSDFAPELSTDGHWLFFHSDRPGGCGNTDIYAAHRRNKRDNFGWDEIDHLGCTLNTGAQDAGPTVFQDPMTGIFTMYINRTFTPLDPESPDIYVSTCAADIASCNREQLWGPAVYVPELSYPGRRDTRTAIRRRDGLEMILTSSRPGGCGGQDLWVSTRATTADPWSIPVNLDPIDPITGLPTCVTNSTALDGAMAISWDGTELYFYSNRPGGFGGNDLYRSTRTKLSE
jgi:WD40-like Beta Propeller Repeat